MDFKQKWENLSPNSKRYVAFGGGVCALLLLSWIFVELSSPSKKAPKVNHTPVQQTPLISDYNVKETTIEALSSELRFLRMDNEKLRREITKSGSSVDTEVRKLREDFSNELRRLKEKNDRLEARLSMVDDATVQINRDVEKNKIYTDEEIAKLKSEGVQFVTTEDGKQIPMSEFQQRAGQENVGETNALNAVDMLSATTPEEFFAVAPTPTEANKEQRAVQDTTTGKPKVDQNGRTVMTERTITITSYVEQKEPEKEKPKADDYIFLPAGSILTGTLISGLDAPTGSSAQKNPFPVLLRIQKEAILPNQYRADVKECFMLLSGYGDLSTERAYLRSETISCIRNDGGVIETSLEGFALGDDSVAGVRGTLVSKQGQIIARSLLAGFAGGFAEMFDTNATPTLNTSSDGTIKYEDVYSSKAVKGAASKGISKSLSRIADFYMELAESMYPVIELTAGRQIDVVIQKGTKLKVKNINEVGNAMARND